ncbi:MAG: hypothetical protein F6K42_05100 [Leptolyngbya sp. SIO1D8]|nr:hypothetical protein [Leptolyngbya sp. SIO1D8]
MCAYERLIQPTTAAHTGGADCKSFTEAPPVDGCGARQAAIAFTIGDR